MTFKQQRMEQDIKSLLSQQRQEMDSILSGQADELRSIENLKQKKMDQQY